MARSALKMNAFFSDFDIEFTSRIRESDLFIAKNLFTQDCLRKLNDSVVIINKEHNIKFQRIIKNRYKAG